MVRIVNCRLEPLLCPFPSFVCWLPRSSVLATVSSRGCDWGRWMVERGHPAYRARQVLDWVIHRRAESFEPMSDLPKSLRQELDAEWLSFATRVAYHGVAPDGTDKLVLECRDGRRIECVLMAEESRRTVCLSTQVGCGIGCVFCASGLKGVERNLSADEILEQVLRLRNLLPPGGNGHAHCRHGNGREPGKSRQPDRCASIGFARPRRG